MGRIKSFDGIRGIAVLLVVFHHFDSFLGVRSAQLGVDLFLVLSGFLITSLLISEIDRTGTISFRTFFVKRALRLVPALLLTVLIFGVGGVALGFLSVQQTFWPALWSLLYVSNWVRSLDLMDMRQFAHTWTLSIEEQFYLFWPLLLLGLIKVLPRYRAVIFAAIILIVVCQATLLASVIFSAPMLWVSSSLPTRSGALFMGALAALLLNGGFLTHLNQAIKYLSFPAAIIVTAVAVYPVDYLIWKQPIAITATAVVVISLAMHKKTLLHQVLELNWLTYVGRISYGIYLYNFPIVWFDVTFFRSQEMSLLTKHLHAIFILLPLTMMLSWASYKYVEKPMLRLKSKFAPSRDHVSGHFFAFKHKEIRA
ncbi:acyltransferase family protein [Brucella haematophila]|uniref:acyltransferase family protein n=1 Tax=Brucella haematophila TaxID=419474 RepID=UPI00110F3971|nr:acyltransferase [Brucella haematophila]TMU86545.1 acyltransferase [Brucella haematophila]